MQAEESLDPNMSRKHCQSEIPARSRGKCGRVVLRRGCPQALPRSRVGPDAGSWGMVLAPGKAGGL